MAERYSDWARMQVHLAHQALNPKVRLDHLALAEFYLKLAEGELAAVKRLEAQSAFIPKAG
jgi:hypothetical protein